LAALIFVFVGLGSVNRAAAQTKVTVIGTVVDSLGMPVIGANIARLTQKVIAQQQMATVNSCLM
jgi:hypothetical protein